MNPLARNILSVLSALALIAVIGAGAYGMLYYRDLSTTARLANEEAARKAAALKPTIDVSQLSCDIPDNTKSRNYSATIRVGSDAVQARQQMVADLIKKSGGTVTSLNQMQVNDRKSGVGTGAEVNGSLPIVATDDFIKKLKVSLAAPESLENESDYTNGALQLRQNCNTNLVSLKGYASTEMVYLDKLNRGEDVLDAAAPSYPANPFGRNSNSVAQLLSDVRITALNMQSSIATQTAQYNMTQVFISIREIAG